MAGILHFLSGIALVQATAQAPDDAGTVRWRANLGAYFGNNDYPREALMRGEEGRVGFRMTVDAHGRVSNCTIIQSSGSQSLDATTCRLARERLRFTPARAADGNPTTDTAEGNVDWSLDRR